ncbi:MAG: hypothetical protein IT285_00165 [Bdellovibrionales bacterium]|nr:hypothetical protein [Bdellovibrionales bacterium]
MRLDFSGVPPAQTLEESLSLLPARARRALEYAASIPQGGWGKNGVGSFIRPAYGGFALNGTAEEFINIVLDPATKLYAKVGVDFVLIPNFCERLGDYDFMLHELVNVMMIWGRGDGPIPPEARRKLLDVLFTEKGANHYTHYRARWCGVVNMKDTENHILMTEVARYLTNDLLLEDLQSRGEYDAQYDNDANGFNLWLLKHLQPFAKNDFDEFNSRPYQGYTTGVLQILYDHTRDARVKTAARIVLDMLAARFALQNHGLRRSVPFRRKVGYHQNHDLIMGDGEVARFAILAGNYASYDQLPQAWRPHYGATVMVRTALTSYRPPDTILDLIIRKNREPVFQKFHHRNVEIFHSSPSFLISAGGVYKDNLDVEKFENDDWAVATTLMPARSGYDRLSFIRFEGHKNEKKRNNTCVAPGFACGLNPVIPDSIPETCMENRGPWTFFRFAAGEEACPLRFGFHAALYRAPCKSSACKRGGSSWGFLEAVEASEISYERFVQDVLAIHHLTPFSDRRLNRYVTHAGHVIEFELQPGKHWEWPIVAIDGFSGDRRMDQWPLAEGPLVKANGKGRMWVRNPWLGSSVVMDYADPTRPQWREIMD